MLDPSFGAGYRTVHEKSGGKRVVVLEWASSAHETVDSDGRPVYAPEQMEALRIAQYPEWIEQAESSGLVASAFCFLVGGTKDWKGCRISERLGRAMGDVVATFPVLGQLIWQKNRREFPKRVE